MFMLGQGMSLNKTRTSSTCKRGTCSATFVRANKLFNVKGKYKLSLRLKTSASFGRHL